MKDKKQIESNVRELEIYTKELESQNTELMGYVDDMKCCGNCGQYDVDDDTCDHNSFTENGNLSVCDNWKTKEQKIK